jgi:hypothetical protein
MTIERYVLCKAASVPTYTQLLDELNRTGLTLDIQRAFDPAKSAEFVPCQFEGLESGFDYSVTAYETDVFDLTESQAFEARSLDTVLELSTYSNAQEIMSSTIIAVCLTRLTNGLLIADFDDDFIRPASTSDWLASKMPSIRKQFSGPSTIRQAMRK